MARPPMAASVQSGVSASSVEEDVKRLVARELHDRVAQTLTGMLIEVENFKSEQVGWEDVLSQLNTIQDSTRQVLQSLRQLLYELRGEESIGARFLEGVAALAVRFEARTGTTVNITVGPGWPSFLSAPSALNLHRIIEEALANVQRHSGAHTVAIALQVLESGDLSVVISDDGRGFDSELSQPGMGSTGMKERALILGGELSIESRPGDGTIIHITFPRAQTAEAAAESNGHPINSRFAPKELSV